MWIHPRVVRTLKIVSYVGVAIIVGFWWLLLLGGLVLWILGSPVGSQLAALGGISVVALHLLLDWWPFPQCWAWWDRQA